MRVSRRVGAPAHPRWTGALPQTLPMMPPSRRAFKHDWASGMQWKHQRPKEGHVNTSQGVRRLWDGGRQASRYESCLARSARAWARCEMAFFSDGSSSAIVRPGVSAGQNSGS